LNLVFTFYDISVAIRRRGIMQASYFLELANRCLSAAEECLDSRAQEHFREIAVELISRANELDTGGAYAGHFDSRHRLRRLHS